jgi:hypothetical protein
MQQLSTNVKKYIPAVDGLRALGVLTVLFYHLRLPFAKSGLLGVTVFFVLSGYLVTRLLLTEADKTGRVDMKDFWKRRGRRIMPGEDGDKDDYRDGFRALKEMGYDKFITLECGTQGERKDTVTAAVELMRAQWAEV